MKIVPQTESVSVVRLTDRFDADHTRVITRPFLPDDEGRIKGIIKRILGMSEAQVHYLLDQVISTFGFRHRQVDSAFEEHFDQVAHLLKSEHSISRERKLLIGSYFTMEYSIESAALFNPSIVPAPDQSGLPHGAVRFIVSLRATGEGHVSSIVFRTGQIDADGHIEFDPISRFVQRARLDKERMYHKHTFFLKLIEMGSYDRVGQKVLDGLNDEFTFAALEQSIAKVGQTWENQLEFDESAQNIRWLAQSNYHLAFPLGVRASEVAIFPTSENESRGIEDARFVQFTDDDGSIMYYGTYTAYNGIRILPQLLETSNFTEFRINTLNGKYVQNKGMALFPRKINGWHVMISRLDGENLYLMRSTNIRFWNKAEILQQPEFHWQFVQIGNCGPPLETEKGWILLTHGVGPMRRYCIGVTLLHRNDPSRVIGQLREPLLVPSEAEREGYVPNVVYSCGAIIHHDHLIIPYGISDSATTFARVSVSQLLRKLEGG